MTAPGLLVDVRKTAHRLSAEPLLELEELAAAASSLPARCIEHHLADLPLLLPDGVARRLPNAAADVIRDLAENECWVMLARLDRLDSYRPLLERAFGDLAAPLPCGEGRLMGLEGTAFLAAPRARVPVHFDKMHGILLQIRGSKTVWTGTYDDPLAEQRELERRLGPEALNASAVPDTITAYELNPGDALVLPAFTFHWVKGGDDVSISLSVGFTTTRTAREVDCHRANVRLRQIHLSPRRPGLAPGTDALKAGAVEAADQAIQRIHNVKRYVGRLPTASGPANRYQGLRLLSAAFSGDLSGPPLGAWQAAASLADEHALSPALWVRLRDQPSVAPADITERLRQAHLSNLGRNLLLRGQLEDVLTRLDASGVPALLLKGALYLLHNPFADFGERVMADLDVMVPPAQLKEATEALAAAGYVASPRPAHEHPHELPMASSEWPALVELHSELGQPALQRVLRTDEAWTDAVPVPGGVGLSPTHAVLHNILHAQVQDRSHATAALPLRQLHTLVAISRAWGPEIEWAIISDRLHEAGYRRELHSYLDLATRCFGWRQPPGVGQSRPGRIHTAAVMTSATLRWPSDVAYNLGNALDASYLDALYHHDGRPTRLALARGRHLLGVLRQGARGSLQQAVLPHR